MLKIFKLFIFLFFIYCIFIFDFTGCFHVYAQTSYSSSADPSSNNFWFKFFAVSFVVVVGVGFMYYNGFGPFSSYSSVSHQSTSILVENLSTTPVVNTVVSAPPPVLPQFVEVLGSNPNSAILVVPYDNYFYNVCHTLTMYQAGRPELYSLTYPIHPHFTQLFLSYYCSAYGLF